MSQSVASVTPQSHWLHIQAAAAAAAGGSIGNGVVRLNHQNESSRGRGLASVSRPYYTSKMHNDRTPRHPLSQPPVNAPSPLPMDSPTPPEAALHTPLQVPIPQRRRFSFPASLLSEHASLSISPQLDSVLSRSLPSVNELGDADPRLAPKPTIGPARPPVQDNVWRELLSQKVDVEGVGKVSLSRFMAEVWKRGGPSIVSERCLWSNVLAALSLPLHGGPAIQKPPMPTAEMTLALQALYNVAVRPTEVTIISGFLTSMSIADEVDRAADSDSRVYGTWTPTKAAAEVDISQWTTLTPGLEWPSLSTILPSGSGLTPGRPFSPALGLPPIEFLDSSSRPSSRAEGGGINGIDEILAQLEDSEAMRESEAIEIEKELLTSTSDSEADKSKLTTEAIEGYPSSRSESVATPMESIVGSLAATYPFIETSPLLSEPSDTPSTSAVPLPVPSQPADCAMASVAVTSGAPLAGPPAAGRQRQPSMQLTMPAPPFIPPPPMCMFFSPSFRDLQTGKVGVWKGDLTIRGRGGGTFNILIVGEEGSDSLWQSHLWGDALSYPPGPVMTESYTATMIPVSTLAREGLLPVTMGMVLCNDDNIAQYVSMVQGLHAEGVAFHLPGSTLPIVFLPSKFDSADPLQRLGVAFMTKGGISPFSLDQPSSEPDGEAEGNNPSPSDSASADAKGRATSKRRRKSKSSIIKPEQPVASPKATRRKSVTGRTRSKTLDGLTSNS